MSENETVDLAAETADEIAKKTADAVAPSIESIRAELADLKALQAEIDGMKAMQAESLKPARSELETAGVKSKPGQESPITGGDDQYTSIGADDAEVATNLYLAQTVLEGNTKGVRSLSERGREVMVKAADRALRAGPRDVQVDLKQFSPESAAGFKSMRAEYFRDARNKAMVSTTASAGDEWVPTFASAELWTDVHLATSIAARIPRVSMPTNPFTLPTLDADPTFYYASTENVAVTGSNPDTGAATLTAKKIQADVTFSGEVTEDSIIAVAPTVRATLVRRGAQTIDDLIVHGDTETGGTGNVNLDDGAPVAGSFFLALDGMRKFCISTNTGQKKQFAAAPTSTLYLNTKTLLGKYGARPKELIMITGQSTIDALLDITGVKLVYEYGPNATVLTGELGQFFGTPILLSEAIPLLATDKVDDDGKYTSTTPSTNDTDGWFVLTNPSQWRTGFRRDLQIESFRDIQKDSNVLVASFRMALIPSGIAVTHTAVGYDITL